MPLTHGSRRQQLHDGIHVLSGYGTDPMGEAAENYRYTGALRALAARSRNKALKLRFRGG